MHFKDHLLNTTFSVRKEMHPEWVEWSLESGADDGGSRLNARVASSEHPVNCEPIETRTLQLSKFLFLKSYKISNFKRSHMEFGAIIKHGVFSIHYNIKKTSNHLWHLDNSILFIFAKKICHSFNILYFIGAYKSIN